MTNYFDPNLLSCHGDVESDMYGVMVTDLSYFHIYVGCRVEDLGGQFQDSLLIYLERLDHETFFFYIISNIVLLNIEWNKSS